MSGLCLNFKWRLLSFRRGIKHEGPLLTWIPKSQFPASVLVCFRAFSAIRPANGQYINSSEGLVARVYPPIASVLRSIIHCSRATKTIFEKAGNEPWRLHPRLA
jgi:hypothetical protein